MSQPDAPRNDPLPLPHPMSRFSDDPARLRRRKNDHVPRLPAQVKQLPDTRKKEIIELPEGGRYFIARRSETEGDIEVLAKQYPYSATWVEMK